jgi:hypothetical protein
MPNLANVAQRSGVSVASCQGTAVVDGDDEGNDVDRHGNTEGGLDDKEDYETDLDLSDQDDDTTADDDGFAEL